ncbi:MAG: hypothetical protein WEB00_06270 [Dehalococcoidia bacterium]
MLNLAAAVLVLATMLLAIDCNGRDPLPINHERAARQVTRAEKFNEYPLFWVGETYEGLPISGIRVDSARSIVGYGTCTLPQGEGGCSIPLQIQIQPICLHWPARFSATPTDVPRPDELAPYTVRGVRARSTDGGLELYTDEVAIKIYYAEGETRSEVSEDGFVSEPPSEELLEVAEALVSINTGIGPGEPLTPASEDALWGRLPCQQNAGPEGT